ncbi:MAG TPA: hypothetical protein VJV04_03310, partial [Nitrospiraceae bacterium]|nr:hypothetical protein [Nitrospiraceae bacterium]
LAGLINGIPVITIGEAIYASAFDSAQFLPSEALLPTFDTSSPSPRPDNFDYVVLWLSAVLTRSGIVKGQCRYYYAGIVHDRRLGGPAPES